jgi:hypothetical protein
LIPIEKIQDGTEFFQFQGLLQKNQRVTLPIFTSLHHIARIKTISMMLIS